MKEIRNGANHEKAVRACLKHLLIGIIQDLPSGLIKRVELPGADSALRRSACSPEEDLQRWTWASTAVIFTLLVPGIQELLRQGTWNVTKKNKSVIDRHYITTPPPAGHYRGPQLERDWKWMGFKGWFRAGAKSSCSASSSLVTTSDFSVPGARSSFDNSRLRLGCFNFQRVWTSCVRSEWLERTRYGNNCSGATEVPWQTPTPDLCHVLLSLVFFGRLFRDTDCNQECITCSSSRDCSRWAWGEAIALT